MSDSDDEPSSDGPEPERVRRLLDVLRDRSPSTQGDEEGSTRRFFEEVAAAFSEQEEPSVAPLAPNTPLAPTAPTAPIAPTESEHRPDEDGVTVRSPELHERIAAAAPAPPPEPVVRSLPVAPPEPRPPAPRRPEHLARRVLALDIPPETRALMPSLPSEPIVRSLPVAPPEPRPPEPRRPEHLAITAPAQDISPEVRALMPSLPFKPSAPGNELARTMESPVFNLLKGQTAPIDRGMIEKPVAALPFPGSTAGAAIVPFPQLTLNQYASLRAELSVAPHWWTAIVRQYHVMNGAALGALDEHWQQELAASPEARATFEEALASYTAWLRAQSE